MRKQTHKLSYAASYHFGDAQQLPRSITVAGRYIVIDGGIGWVSQQRKRLWTRTRKLRSTKQP
jgi:hypothetical protein